MKSLLIENISVSELQDIIAIGVRTELAAIQSKTFEKLNYTKQDFANLIGRSISFIDKERRSGKLKWHRLGGIVMIPATELDKYTIQAS